MYVNRQASSKAEASVPESEAHKEPVCMLLMEDIPNELAVILRNHTGILADVHAESTYVTRKWPKKDSRGLKSPGAEDKAAGT